MPDIMVVLACVSQCVELTTLRQLGRVIEAMLSISGRVTMKGLSRWSGPGGSYRTIQRLFHTPLHWLQLNWLLIRHHLLDGDEVALMSGDHVVVTKSGKTTSRLRSVFFLALWQSGPRPVFSEFIPAQRQAPYLLIPWLPSKLTSPARPRGKRLRRSRPVAREGAPQAARIAIVAR